MPSPLVFQKYPKVTTRLSESTAKALADLQETAKRSTGIQPSFSSLAGTLITEALTARGYKELQEVTQCQN